MGLIKVGGGGGGGGVLQSAGQSILASNFTITAVWTDDPGGSLAQVSTVEVTATFSAGARVLITFLGSCSVVTGADLMIGYQIDSDTPITAFYQQALGSGTRAVNFTALSEALAGGSHTIKLMAASAGGSDPVMQGVTNLNAARFEVIEIG